MSNATPIRVGIIGGGTAGYLTALALRVRRPDVQVTMIESSRIPIIGVGEGSTPIMVPFLHGYLGLDVRQLHEEVRPTWKVGVRLEWGAPDDSHFEFPFDAHGLTDSYYFSGNINSCSLGALLMGGRYGLHLQRGDWTYQSLAPAIPYGYHLDNRRFVRYLQRRAAELGVHPVDALISRAEIAPSGGLAAIVADDGRRFEFDVYVDCSGFASMLLGESAGAEFISYSKNLFTNSAIVGDCPHHGRIGPFTNARTMAAGWCWSLPQMESDHRGYVFCSDFINEEQADYEMRQVCPGLSPTRLIKFRSGRRKRWWNHNIVGLGNAYAFVEPLEATALHMVIRQISYFVADLDEGLKNPPVRESLNNIVATLWDNLSGLLALHYKYNRRMDTPFWQTCRADTDLGAIEPAVEAVAERGPSPGPRHDPASGTLLGGLEDEINLLLLGMKVFDPDLVLPSTNEQEWRRWNTGLQGWVRRGLSVEDSLSLVRRDSSTADPSGGRWYEGVLSGLENPVR